MNDSIQPPKCHMPHEARMFAGILVQHLPPEMTGADMEAWRQDPEGLAAVLAGLKSPPKMPAGHATAPLHVGTPPRTVDFQREDGGITKGVVLARPRDEWNDAARAFQEREYEGTTLPMLKSLNDENSGASVERVKQTRRSSGGCELPPEIVD